MTLRHFDSNSQDPQRFTWAYIRSIALEHRRELFAAHFVAVLAALSAVPVPLLMPLLVDEVLLNKPGMAIATLDRIFPAEWHGPPLYILAILAMTLLLRLITAIFNVWQTRQFSLIAKDVIYRIRCRLISKLQRISMAEYENLGSGSVVTHLVTDLDTLDAFIGTTIAPRRRIP
jgi:ATP-binding cassette subfamily C protein